jgi:hypothetical protein
LYAINPHSVRAVLEAEENAPSSAIKARSSKTTARNVTFSEAVSHSLEHLPIQIVTPGRKKILNQNIPAGT